MDIEFEPGGDMKISLNVYDIDMLEDYKYCTVRDGLAGSETKTWITRDPYTDIPRAEIDDGNDLNIYIPNDQQLPFEVPREMISSPMDSHGGKTEFYFGEMGKIAVKRRTG